MFKVFLGRILPLGATAMLLKSSFSPLEPALRAFGAANAALSGQSTNDSGADFESMAKKALAGAGLGNGAAQEASSKEELNDIIKSVKARSVASGEAKPDAKAKKGKGGKGKSEPKKDKPAEDAAPPEKAAKNTKSGKGGKASADGEAEAPAEPE
jgi:hypothetical protein